MCITFMIHNTLSVINVFKVDGFLNFVFMFKHKISFSFLFVCVCLQVTDKCVQLNKNELNN